jgi:hypothetical protein
MKHSKVPLFFQNYPGPRGRHLSNLTKLSLTGEPKEGGDKRPGKALMRMIGKNYDPHKSRFNLSENDQVVILMAQGKK